MSAAETLPCTAFEQFMLAQDSPRFPCVMTIRVSLVGTVNREHFKIAAQKMIERHPMLRGVLETNRSGSRWFFPTCASKPEISWHETPMDADCCPARWIDDEYLTLDKSSGLRIVVHSSAADTKVYFQCHHACADGLGLLGAIHDLWTVYDGLANRRPFELPKSKKGDLRTRNRFGLTWFRRLLIAPGLVLGLVGVWNFLLRRPVQILRPRLEQKSPTSTGGPQKVSAITHFFDAEASQLLLVAAKSRQVTMNDLLASVIFAGVARFRNKLSEQKDRDWLRMMVPVNMRTMDIDSQRTACNNVSCVFLDRTPLQIRDWSKLLKSVHLEMLLIKGNSMALLFIGSLWINKCLNLLPRGARVKRCMTSFVFTNLGKIFSQSSLCRDQEQVVAGDIVIRSVEVLPPLTQYVWAAFSTTFYARKLSLSLRYHPSAFDQNAAQMLLTFVVTAAQQVMQGGVPVTEPSEIHEIEVQ